MRDYIQVSDTPDGVLYIDTRVNNSVHAKISPDSNHVYPISTSARHMLGLLWMEELKDCNITWEQHQ